MIFGIGFIIFMLALLALVIATDLLPDREDGAWAADPEPSTPGGGPVDR